MLRGHNLTGTFYVPRLAPRGTMSPAQLRELAGEFEVGAHTLDHVHLTDLGEAESGRQIADSKSWLEDATGRPCLMFCPPAGRFTRRHLRAIRDRGYLGVRSVELLSLSGPRRIDGLLVMPTTLQAYPHRALTYARNAAKRCGWANLWNYILHGRHADWEMLAESLLRRALAGGGVYHLWGHSWELEQTDQWERLERVLSLLGGFGAEAPCISNAEVCRRASGLSSSHSAHTVRGLTATRPRPGEI